MKKILSEMTCDELQLLYEKVKAEEAALLVELFGAHDGVRYGRLQRAANSYFDVGSADAAYAEVERIEARLTEDQRNRLFGIGETNVYDAEEIRAELRKRQ